MAQSKERLEINVDHFNIQEYWKDGKGSIFDEIQETEEDKNQVCLIMLLL